MVLQPHQRTIMRSRSLSPPRRAPYLWHEREPETMDRESRKGWYRVDYGPNKREEVHYFPTFKDKMNFLERSVVRATSEPRIRATSVPPSTVAVRRSGALSVDPIVTYPYRWRTWPFYYHNYRWPYTTYYDRYWPSLGSYSGRIWRLPWYRYPSSPLTASTSWRSYAPARYTPRYYPSYLDYDYGYGGYYYPYLYPRTSRYDYLDDLDSSYHSTTYRPRAIDIDTDYRDKAAHPTTTATTTKTTATKATSREVDDRKALGPHLERRTGKVKSKAYTLSEDLAEESEAESRMTRLDRRYPRISESQMLHDTVESMRHRLKSLAYSLDPTGPVPEIIIPERTTTTTTTTKKSTAAAPLAIEDKKYSTALEYTELPKLASRRQRYYPEDEHMKDNLRIQCLSHYKTTRTAADYWKPKQYIPTEPLSVMPDTSSFRASKYSSTKWEEPDTVYGGPSDKKPYSKAITDGTSEETSEERKERRKKKKSKERDVLETTTEATSGSITTAAAADHSTSEADPVSATTDDAAAGDDEEKERKKQEKKKRKAEREAAAKAAMEAELAALAAAEAELARLEAESSKTDDAATDAAPAESAPAEVKSESAAEKCESSTEVVCEVVCVKPESLDELVPSQTPPQVPPQEKPEVQEFLEEPQAAPETEQAVEPQTEEPQPEITEEEAIMEDLPPLKESQIELPPVEEPAVELPSEEPATEESPAEEPTAEEPPVEPPTEEAPVEETPVEETSEDSPVEPPVQEAPGEPSDEPLVEVQQTDEPQAEPAVDEPQVEEPKPEPSVEAKVEETSVEEEPIQAPPRRAAFDEDSGWLDAWDGEAATVESSAQETGQHLGTDESEEPVTIQAEEARLGAQEDTEAPVDATATTTDAADATQDADPAADVPDVAEAGTEDTTADVPDAAPPTEEDIAE